MKTARARWLIPLVVCVPVALGYYGCGEEKKEKDAGSKVTGTVASVGDSGIRADELKALLASRPLRGDQAALKEWVKTRLEEWITAEVLAQEALRLELDEKPEIKRKIRQILSQELLEAQVQKPVRERKFSEEELKRYFEEHKGEYSRPEQVRLSDIFIAVPEGATPEERKAKRERAEEALAKAREAKDNRFGFAELVRKYSDKHPLFRTGDTGFFDQTGKPIGVDPALAEAGFRLKENRQLAENVIETPEGFHVIMLVGRRSAVNTEFKDVASAVERRLRSEDLQKRRAEYIEGLKKDAKIKIDGDLVTKLAAELEKEQKAAPLPERRIPPRGGRMGNAPGLPEQGQQR